MLSLDIRCLWTFRFNLLLWKHLANWNQTWHDINVHWMVFQKKPVLLFQKRAFPYYIWILIMSPKVDILFYSDFFLPLLLLLSEACPDHNLFFFPDRSIIFGMWVHDHVAYRNHLRGTQYLGCPLQPSSELCTWFVSHNWMTLFRLWGNPPPPPPEKRGTSRCMTTLNEEYKDRVTYCSHLASVVCELLDLIFSSGSTWQIETKRDMIWMFIEWFPTKTCVVVSKEF